jgi:hypothetical protein
VCYITMLALVWVEVQESPSESVACPVLL